MGRLAGFSADEVIRRLRQASSLIAKPKGAMKYGGTLKLALVLRCVIILATYLKERYELFCVKLD